MRPTLPRLCCPDSPLQPSGGAGGPGMATVFHGLLVGGNQSRGCPWPAARPLPAGRRPAVHPLHPATQPRSACTPTPLSRTATEGGAASQHEGGDARFRGLLRSERKMRAKPGAEPWAPPQAVALARDRSLPPDAFHVTFCVTEAGSAGDTQTDTHGEAYTRVRAHTHKYMHTHTGARCPSRE